MIEEIEVAELEMIRDEELDHVAGGAASTAGYAEDGTMEAAGAYVGGDVGFALGEAIDPLGGGFFGWAIGNEVGAAFGHGAYLLSR